MFYGWGCAILQAVNWMFMSWEKGFEPPGEINLDARERVYLTHFEVRFITDTTINEQFCGQRTNEPSLCAFL